MFSCAKQKEAFFAQVGTLPFIMENARKYKGNTRVQIMLDALHCLGTQLHQYAFLKMRGSWGIMFHTRSRLELPKIELHHIMVKPHHIM